MRDRKWILLLVLLAVGVAFVSDASAQAISIKSVQLTSPDSGARKGIDSTFVVRVAVQDFNPASTMQLVVYLGTADTALVTDTTWTDSSFGSLSQVSAIRVGLDTTSAGARERITSTTGTYLTNASGVVAALARRGTGTVPYNATVTGDRDSVVITSATDDTTVFEWRGSIHASSPEVKAVKAFAFAIKDNSDTSNTASSTNTFFLDGDRPTNPDNFVDVDGNGLKSNAGKIDQADAGGETLIDGFPSAGSHYVLGIGDTLITRVKLGTANLNPVLGSDSLEVVLEAFGKRKLVFKRNSVESSRSGDTLKFEDVLAEGEYNDLNEAWATTDGDTLQYFIVDPAGNYSSVNTDDVTPQGVTAATALLFDTSKPGIDTADGDSLLPASSDTITDGGINVGFGLDLNPMMFKLTDALDSLIIKFTGDTTATVVINPGNRVSAATSTNTDNMLEASQWRRVDFSGLTDTTTTDWKVIVSDSASDGASTVRYDSTGGNVDVTVQPSKMPVGTYSIALTPTDLAGNTGSATTRTGVYIDGEDIDLVRLFPTSGSALDTLEEETAKVVFQLSEAADSVLISYTRLAGNDAASKVRSRPLAGTELTNTSAEQTFVVDSLVSGTQYKLQIVAADLAGNYTQTAPDTFVYDTAFVVPVIAKFTIAANTAKTGTGNSVAAGDTLILTLSAKTVTDAAAVTYKEEAELKVTTGSGVVLTGTGVTDQGNGRATLSADDWVVGTRTVVLSDTSSVDTLSVAIQDCTDTTNIYVGSLDSVVVINPTTRSQLIVDADESVGQGDDFWVSLTLADKYGNVRVADNGFVAVAANQLGVQVPVGDVPITKGMGGFWANSASYAGDLLILTAKEVSIGGSVLTTVISGNDTISVDGTGSAVLAAPATVIAKDYMGAKGTGDQGGFITLSFTPSADHATLTGYRIYREVAVFAGYDTGGNLVELSEPTMELVPWGIVDAVTGADPMHVVVATLDGDSTTYGVAAERGMLTTAKSAFDGAESVATPYEMLAETMQKSRTVTDGPVFASLTPEALAFSANGVLPRLKVVDGVEQSSITKTASAVRAVDNIAPEAVPFVQAMDTPADAGSSITVTWAKSASDQLVTQVVPQAIGGSNVYTTEGVQGYNVYRKVGDAAYTLVGSANAGATSFEDVTAFNGVRYTYQVRPFDADNITASEIEKSAMAIRNNVVDANGAPVYGLFGVDNKVDYDDFFIFADHFGLSAGEDAFDKAFDLSPNNTIDFDDFFAFADNFGKEIVATGKVVPMLAGLNSDARFYLDAGTDLPRVGEELAIDVNLENFVELQAYGFGMSYDASVLEFVGARVDNNILGEGQLAQPQVIAQGEGTVSLAAFGDVATKGELGLSLVFRTLEEIEASYIEITNGALQDGSYGLNNVTGPVSVRIETRPEVYALSDNYPNPFNPETTIKYQLPNAGDVTLEVYNMLGQVVSTLVSEQQNAGRYVYQWDATNDAGQALSSGIYFYRIQAGGEFQSVKKMLLLK